jgi:hypothetical protein
MAGLDPAIHVFLAVVAKDVDAGTSPGMTNSEHSPSTPALSEIP